MSKKFPNYKWAEKQLKTCPFCDSKVMFLPQDMPKNVTLDKVKPLKCYGIRCSMCNVMMKVYTRFQSQAICQWNFRQGKI